MKRYLLLLLVGLSLSGCANDYYATALEEPANNLPLSRPDPVPDDQVDKNGNVVSSRDYVPAGSYYPVNGP